MRARTEDPTGARLAEADRIAHAVDRQKCDSDGGGPAGPRKPPVREPRARLPFVAPIGEQKDLDCRKRPGEPPPIAVK